ncbi:MAG: nucleotide sugar dehydrogenase [Calditrichaeota bacterium]|nr:nucleotide sugar dehydrogenase [Calditrichota bacterium]
MGYVGLPLALEFGRKGLAVIGFDIDQDKVDMLKEGRSYIKHIPSDAVAAVSRAGMFDATTDFRRIAETDAVIICVPTPLGPHWEPDLSFIESTARSIAPYLHPGQLVSLESTTYPGTTEEVLVPLLEAGSGLRAGVDFRVAFSPEREDPNNRNYTTATIPKVVGGLTPECLAVASAMYGEIIERVVPVSSCATAESTKLLENIFRSVNIALVNELKVIFHRMGIDVWEVIEAASTKPFGYMPFYPGPGLGGHCIPIDPFYLSWKAREYGIATRFIELAGEINTAMPEYVIDQTMKALNERRRSLKGTRVLIVGLAYKGDVDDLRESPSLRLIELFETAGAETGYYDPFIPVIPRTREHASLAGRRSIDYEEAGQFDVAVISTRHSPVDHAQLLKWCELVVDTRRAIAGSHPNLVRA